MIAEGLKPIPCPDPLVSPIIAAGQVIFQEKRGVAFNALATQERSPWTTVKVRHALLSVAILQGKLFNSIHIGMFPGDAFCIFLSYQDKRKRC